MAKESYNGTRALVPTNNSEMPDGITRSNENRISEDVKKSLDLVFPYFPEIVDYLNNINKNLIADDKKPLEKNQKKEDIRRSLNNEKTIKDSEDFFKKIQNNSSKFFDNLIKSSSKMMDKNSVAIRGSLLGPLNLVLKPIEDFTGTSLNFSSFFEFTSKSFKSLLAGKQEKSINKKHPSESDLVKNKELGSLFVVDFLKKNMGEKKDTKLDDLAMAGLLKGGSLVKGAINVASGASSLLASAGKGGLSKLIPLLRAVASPIAIITSILMAVIDGIKAIFKSEDWGVSKISAFFAGFFSSTDSGWKGAFSAMGKWALLGVGIGLPFAPPIGPIVGGILGAVIGGILGFIGGEKLAKGFDKLGAWFKDNVWQAIKNYFLNLWESIKSYFLGFKDIWSSDKSLPRKLGETVRHVFIGIWNWVTFPFREGGKVFKSAIKLINNLIKKIDFKEVFLGFFGKIKTGLSNIGGSIWDGIMGMINRIKSFFTWENIKNTTIDTVKFLTNIADSVFGFIYEFIGGLFGIETTWEDFKEKISDVLDRFIVKPISNVFNKIIDVFQYIGDLFEFVKSQGWGIFETTITGKFGEKFNEYRIGLGREISVDDAILRKDGTVVRTSPDDNIIATKNDPTNFGDLNKFTNEKLNTVDTLDNTSINNRLDKMIGLLAKLVDKDVTITMPSQTKQDLIHIVEGVI